MPAAFRAVGAATAIASGATLGLVAPASVVANDILIAQSYNRSGAGTLSAPDGTWTNFALVDMSSSGFATQFAALWWRRAQSGDASATFNFGRAVATTTVWMGNISAWSGCLTTGSPLDASAPTVHRQTSSDVNIYYDTYTPAETAAFVVAMGFYGNDQVALSPGIAGTDPTFTNHWGQETALGSDGLIYGHSGSSTGAATGARQQIGTQAAISISVGILFGLIGASGQAPRSMQQFRQRRV